MTDLRIDLGAVDAARGRAGAAARRVGVLALVFALGLAACRSAGGPGGVERAPEPPATTSTADAPAAKAGEPRRDAGAASLPITREAALETFDTAWTRIYTRHFDPDFGGVDWHAVRDELRPRAAEVETLAELRAVLTDMLGRLSESHFGLIPQEAADATEEIGGAGGGGGGPGDVGMDVRIVGDQVLVWRVDPDGPAAAAGVRPGWELVSIDGFSVPEALAKAREALADIEPRLALPQIYSGVMGRVRGEPGTSVSLGFRDARDEPVERTLTRRPMPGELTKFGNLPPLVARLEHERVDAGDGVTAGVIRFNVWMIPIAQEFARAIDELRDVDGVILDLRGNIGGVAGMTMGIAGHFMREVVPLGTMRTRSGELRIVSNPQRVNSRGERVEPLDVPLAIVLDGLSFSTTEVFAGGLQAVGRARVFGETSGGQALPAIMERLPNGDVLMQAIADFTAPNGERIEGRGVVPDETVPLTRADLLAGRDAPVEAALRWIREQASEREGGS